jgi:hypothetical protein
MYDTTRNSHQWAALLQHSALTRAASFDFDGTVHITLPHPLGLGLEWLVWFDGTVSLVEGPWYDRKLVSSGRDAEIALENAIADSSPLLDSCFEWTPRPRRA